VRVIGLRVFFRFHHKFILDYPPYRNDCLVGNSLGNFTLSFPVILCLEIQPEAFGHAEVVRQTVGDIDADGPGSAHDLGDALQRHVYVVSEPGLAYSDRLEKLFLKDFSRTAE
jgi:hypothetical protein